ncbi:hypothetical protein GH975_01975 [Litorivicinus lipolyticus]|uniref:Uncharacterized protein n=1 Tax=Litorivicinus lipolyticus TaxID=418701 RepID=A0A5Q2QBN0_9GAMM|nr:hypothetical protein [Litorivicinus lipolyticus]QGG79397.1 hypothetical protein GH975_01975 [Litorivicinus lipolyticus]
MKRALVRHDPRQPYIGPPCAGVLLTHAAPPVSPAPAPWIAIDPALLAKPVAPSELGRRYRQSRQAGIRSAWIAGALCGQACTEIGINLVLGPDVALGGLSDDADAVVALGRAWAMGLTASGVMPMLTPYPGHPAGLHGQGAIELSPGDLILDATRPVRELGPMAPFVLASEHIYRAIDSSPLEHSAHALTWADTVTGYSGVVIGKGRAAIMAGCDWALCDASELGDIPELTRPMPQPKPSRPLDRAALTDELAGLGN